MANNSEETGAHFCKPSIDSLLATPPEMDTESEGRQGKKPQKRRGSNTGSRG